MENSNVVYHYCSAETFMKIISQSTLRMTNIRKSNDCAEITACVGLFQTSTRSACERYMKIHPENVTFSSFYKSANIDRLIERSIDNESCTYYCTCFSKARDLLSQWRGYADGGKGIAIGIKSDFLTDAAEHHNMEYMPIEYDAIKAKADLTARVLRRIEDCTEEYVRKGVLTQSTYESLFFRIVGDMIYDAVFYKNSAFQEEQETRLVYYPFGHIQNLHIAHKSNENASNQLYYDKMKDISQPSNMKHGFARSELGFSLCGETICSYIDLSFAKKMPFIIPEIILGPKNQMNDLDLRLFLLAHNVDLVHTKISRSNSTYR